MIPDQPRKDVIGVRVTNPAWRKYMRKYDVWEGDGHDQLEEHEVPTERLCPGDGSSGPVRGQD